MESMARQTTFNAAPLRAFYVLMLAFYLLSMSAVVREALQPHGLGGTTITVVASR